MSLHMPHCAIILLDYLEINQGENWLFHETNIKKDTDLKGKDTFYKAKSELLNAGLITWQGLKNGIKIRVNYDVRKTDVQNLNVQKSDVQNPDNIERKKTERKGENKRKGENTHTCSSVASAPAGAAASVCVSPSLSPESPSQEGKTKASPKASKASKASKAPAVPVSENPPSQEDIAAYISKVISGRPEASAWNEQSISGTAFDIWNHYTNTGWKTAACCPMYIWQNAVIGWLRRNSWLPEQQQPHPSPVPAASPAPASNELSNLQPGQWAGTPIRKTQQKSFRQLDKEWIERPLTDPDSVTAENAAWCIFNATCEDEVQGTLNSIPAHLHERALALAEQMRKEQGDRPRIITTPSTFTYENDDNEDK